MQSISSSSSFLLHFFYSDTFSDIRLITDDSLVCLLQRCFFGSNLYIFGWTCNMCVCECAVFVSMCECIFCYSLDLLLLHLILCLCLCFFIIRNSVYILPSNGRHWIVLFSSASWLKTIFSIFPFFSLSFFLSVCWAVLSGAAFCFLVFG